MNKIRLVRSRKNKMISGVFGGLEDLIHIDATILRLSFILIAFFTAIVPALIIYVLCAVIIPLEEEKKEPIIIDLDENEKTTE